MQVIQIYLLTEGGRLVNARGPIGMDETREQNAQDHAGVRFPPPLVYALGLVAGWALEQLAPIGSPPAAVAIPLGVLCLLGFVFLDLWSMVLFRRLGTSVVPFKPATVLITSGPYRLTRNPMYVGLGLLYAGIALVFGLGWGLLLLPAVMLIIHLYVVPREERYLERRFGEEYGAYRSRVRRWL